jgi:hypothetical protein
MLKVGFITTFGLFNVINSICYVIGSYWAFLSLILGRKLEIATNFPNYLTKAMLSHLGMLWKLFDGFGEQRC